MSAIILKDSSYIHNYAFAFTLTTKLMRENVQRFFFFWSDGFNCSNINT